MKQILAFTPRRLKLLLIALPFVLALIYLLVLAADRYVSESIVSVRQANQEGGSLPGVALLLGGGNPASRDDTLYLRQYIHSLDLLKRLDAKLNLRQHYQTPPRDVFFRLAADADQERFLDYYRSRVEIGYDDNASLLTIRVQGFDPDFAQRLNRAILDDCEVFVNAFSQRMARAQMVFSETELNRSAKLVSDTKGKVLAFQTKYKLLDPLAQVQTTGAVTAGLQASLSRQEADMRNALTYLNEDSYQIKALRNQLESTRAQLDAERTKSTTGSGDRLNALAAQYQELELAAGFALDGYRAALAATENARIEASRNLKSLVVIEPPSRAETADYPRRIYNLATILVVSLLAYAIARLIVATVREHTD